MHGDDSITTIEGLGSPENLHPMQAAFVRHDAFQCGYCTPGQICSAVAVLDEIKASMPSHVSSDLDAASYLDASEIRERMSGNICRCGAYSNIVEAIEEVAGRSEEHTSELQSLMRISYAVFCLKKKKQTKQKNT